MRVGPQIRRERLRLGLRQEDLAIRIGCSQELISKYEIGRKTPSVAKLTQIAMAIGCSFVIN